MLSAYSIEYVRIVRVNGLALVAMLKLCDDCDVMMMMIGATQKGRLGCQASVLTHPLTHILFTQKALALAI